MKRKSFFVFILLMVMTTLLFGCGVPGTSEESLKKVYPIGINRTFADESEALLVHNIEEEMFVFSHTKTTDTKIGYFNFSFSNGNAGNREHIRVRNSEDFTYIDSQGNEIIFDEQGYYKYYGDVTIYISYKNARQSIKDSIAEGGYSIGTGHCGTFADLQSYISW